MKINVPFTKLQHVVHLADIHIRLFRRHDEYEQAFERLYSDIRSKQLEDFVIVLAGDIVHAKTDMSPEMVQVTSRFLKNISDIAPTILIAGNHDCNLANTNRMDALTPIVNNLQHPNLYYVRDSAVVYIADTAFAVCSIFDEQDKWPTPDEIEDVDTKIALYHGPVHGSTTDANFTITNRHVHVDTFTGYDIVMLGDIHKHQVLKEADPIIVYASSLIQQNHGETLENHGWCLWDIPHRTFDFVTLENEYGYVTLEVHNTHITYPSNMPKNVRMRLFTEDLDNTEVKKIITTLRNNHNIIELSVNKNRFNKNTPRIANTSHDTLDLTQVNVQNNLITQWLNRNYVTLDPEVLTAIETINKDLNNKIINEDQSRNIHWRPLKFTFSNMFSYGENNEIDFTDMKGVYGIFAANASGKSSIMDSLMFCLYDKTPRAFKGDHIINNRKDNFVCELTFEINNETFGIKRVGTRKKNGDVKVDASFWKILDNGDILNLNGEDRRDTNANIRSHVGTYEDFIMTAMSSQNSNALFIDKSHSERKDLLIQFMGLNIFDKLFDAAHDEAKEITGILKRFKKSDVTDQIAETHTKLQSVEQSIHSYDLQKDNHEGNLEDLEEEYRTCQSTKRPVPEVSGSLEELEVTFKKTQQLLKKAQENHDYTKVNYEKTKEEYAQLTSDFEAYDMGKLQESVANYNKFNDLLVKGNAALRVVNTKIEEKVKFKNKLSGYKYNPDCDVCVTNNKSVVDDLATVNVELDELNAKRLIQEDSITKIIEELEPLKLEKEVYDEAIEAQSLIQKTHQTQQRLKVELESAFMTMEKNENKLGWIQLDIDAYKLNEENILHNQKIETELQDIQLRINNTKKQIQTVDRELRILHGDSSVLAAKKKELTNKLKEAEELETTYEAYNHYMLAVGRDGVPYELMSKAIPNMEAEINSMLSQIVDFTVSLEVDGKNINGKLNYDFDRIWPLENSSGMERFVSSLAIRVALLNASNLPKSNMLIIDEGFGVLDAEHMHSMQTLFNLLKTHFDFILIVSHLDTARDMVDNLIEIRKEDGYSQISV
jgi:DNA repair exonuclease SbcCD ATPase subunit/DNA repair exonuclease SbcCD nuclease subunit